MVDWALNVDLITTLGMIFAAFGGGIIVGTYRSLQEIKKAGRWVSKHFDGIFSYEPLHPGR